MITCLRIGFQIFQDNFQLHLTTFIKKQHRYPEKAIYSLPDDYFVNFKGYYFKHPKNIFSKNTAIYKFTDNSGYEKFSMRYDFTIYCHFFLRSTNFQKIITF